MHLTDEQFTSYLLGAPDADIRDHLDRCAECRAEAHLLSETVLEVSEAFRSEAARAQALAGQPSAARPSQAESLVCIPKAFWHWKLAPVLVIVVIAAVLFGLSFTRMSDRSRNISRSTHENPTQSVPNQPVVPAGNSSSQSPLAERTVEPMQHGGESPAIIAANQNPSSQDDDALLRSIQEDASREVPAALEPAVVIVDERARIAELQSTSRQR